MDSFSKTDKSFGIIPIKRVADQWQVLLIHQFSKIGNNSYWVFPKGHAEGNETALQSARRELFEETGLKAEKIVQDSVFSLAYSFQFDGVKIEKTVDFYIGVITDDTVVIQTEEVKEARWCSLEEAKERLDYSDTKKMFFEVQEFLKTFDEEPRVAG
jgi:tRNA nucleotidyltransferase (CCA-adding enzyme)